MFGSYFNMIYFYLLVTISVSSYIVAGNRTHIDDNQILKFTSCINICSIIIILCLFFQV